MDWIICLNQKIVFDSPRKKKRFKWIWENTLHKSNMNFFYDLNYETIGLFEENTKSQYAKYISAQKFKLFVTSDSFWQLLDMVGNVSDAKVLEAVWKYIPHGIKAINQVKLTSSWTSKVLTIRQGKHKKTEKNYSGERQGSNIQFWRLNR